MKMNPLLAASGAALLSISLAHAENPGEAWTDPPATVGVQEEATVGVQEEATVGVQEDDSTYIGTSLPAPRQRIYLENPNSAFPDPERDGNGYVVGTAGPEKGTGDEYGSVLFDVGVQP